MTFKYKKQLFVGIIVVILCVASIGLTYLAFGQKSLSAESDFSECLPIKYL